MTNETVTSPGLRRLEDVVLSGVQHPAILTRPQVCDSATLGELIRDIAALANTHVVGQRYVVFGVQRESETATTLIGVSTSDHDVGRKLERSLGKFFEPQLNIRYIRWRAGSSSPGLSLGVLILDHCKDAPYLIRRDALPATQVGDAWIRRKGRTVRLRRSDLDRLYEERFVGPTFDGRVRVQFACDPPSEFIRLTATSSSPRPSHLASEKISALVQARQIAVNAASNEMTYIGRLSQARIMGCDVAYADKSLTTLKLELAKVADTYRLADDQHRLEHESQQLNIQIMVEGAQDIENASLALHVPAHAGITILNDKELPLDTMSGDAPLNLKRYPRIERGREMIRIAENFERLSSQRPTIAFGRPLQVVIDRAALDQKIPVHYRLHGSNLRHAVTGKLYIVCTA